jgi:hypothetical protein
LASQNAFMEFFDDLGEGPSERERHTPSHRFASEAVSSQQLIALIGQELESIAGTIDTGGDWPLENLSGNNIAFLQSLDLCAQQLKTLSLLLADYRELSNEEFEFRLADQKRNLDLFEK